ncbi:MAG: Tex-like N-terminal domain-containing protein [Planctomycetota bacterium]
MSTSVTIDLKHVARGLGIPLRQVQTVVELLDEGNTVPFITRYRKDQTGGLDEEQLRQVQSRLTKLRLLAERKQTILRSIESQGKLTEQLAEQILGAHTTKRLEDLYLPFKPKKQTLATAARNRGLEPLAREILAADPICADLDGRAKDFVNPDKQVPTAADALLGAGHILAEQFSEQAELRQRLREILQATGKIVSAQVATEARPSEKQDTKEGKEGKEGKAEPKPEGVRAGAEQLAGDAAPPPSELAPSTGNPAQVEHGSGRVGAATESPSPSPTEVEETASTPEKSASEHMESSDPAGDCETLGSSSASPTDPEASEEGPPPERVAPLEEQPAVMPAAEGATAEANDEIAPEVRDPMTTMSEPLPEAASPPAPPPKPPAPVSSRMSAKAREKAARQAKKEAKRKRLEEQRIKAFRDYFGYTEEIRKIPPHRVLAINRGERAKVIRVRLEYDVDAMYASLDEMLVPPEHPHAEYLRGCARDALQRLILPSLEREVRRELTDKAEQHAVEVFAKNLRNLLLQPPVHDRRVLAVDPGYKSGCKLVALDQFGNILEHGVIFLVGKPERKEEAKHKVLDLIERFGLTVVAIGNGTACRAVEDFFAELLAGPLQEKGVAYVIVNEAGASVYSTSRIGREEFPTYDATLRGAISIGRRLQDPLSELVKIEPANIGVGLYQHDVKAKHLETSLDDVVESCVNYVGVEVNTASPALLRYVSGLNQLTARRVYEYRCEHGPFRNRQQLRDVPGFGEATFVQAAGFLKIAGGDNPLDATWIHPESYPVAEQLLSRLGGTTADLRDKQAAGQLAQRAGELDREALAKELQAGEMTLCDILAQFARPGRDPRDDLPAPVFKQGVLKLEDLTPGMELTGTVLNVVDFGAFVDIGMHDSGLVHVSHLADRYVRDPHEVVAVGDIVKVWVLEVDKERRRVSLTMVRPGSERPRHPRYERQGGRPPEGAAAGQGPPAGARHDRGQRPPRPAGPRGDRPPREGAPPQGGRDRGGRPPRHDRGPYRGPPQRPRYELPKPKPKPLVPITEGMKQGKEPMRTFGDLLQFYEVKHNVELAPKPAVDPSKGKKDKRDLRDKRPPAPNDKDHAAEAAQQANDRKEAERHPQATHQEQLEQEPREAAAPPSPDTGASLSDPSAAAAAEKTPVPEAPAVERVDEPTASVSDPSAIAAAERAPDKDSAEPSQAEATDEANRGAES